MLNDIENIRTVAGKREFLKNYLNSVRDNLISKAAKMPAEWDGFELRWLVADQFNWEQRHRTREYTETTESFKLWRRRVKAYTNELTVRCL